MTLTLTFTPSVGAVKSFLLSDDAFNALDAYRLALTDTQTPGLPQGTPIFATVTDMLSSFLVQYILAQALERTPPASVLAAVAAAATAQTTLEGAKALALVSALVAQ